MSRHHLHFFLFKFCIETVKQLLYRWYPIHQLLQYSEYDFFKQIHQLHILFICKENRISSLQSSDFLSIFKWSTHTSHQTLISSRICFYKEFSSLTKNFTLYMFWNLMVVNECFYFCCGNFRTIKFSLLPNPKIMGRA